MLRLQAQLRLANIPHVAIREPDAPFNGEVTAIGLIPGPKVALSPWVRDFNMIRGDWQAAS